ncbi:MAG: phospholipid/cholesterol/gamma-HCH transport system substrate-binding protein, partial [Myxococcota bacterium]
VRETSSTTTDDFKFSFQFAKRWHFLTARFGIMESTGGIGLDAEFFKDSLKLTTDLFDFSADLSPRLRILANYTFFKHFEVSGGVDDVFNEDRFDWFLGIGIRFTDDDLKALLTVAPAPAL